MFHSICVWQFFPRRQWLDDNLYFASQLIHELKYSTLWRFKHHSQISCEFLLILQQIRVQMCENDELMSSFVCGMNLTRASISLSPYHCCNYCNWIHARAGRNPAPDWSRRLLVLGGFDWVDCSLCLSVCEWPGLVCFGVVLPLVLCGKRGWGWGWWSPSVTLGHAIWWRLL
jgi:hypothetical protein